MKKIHRVLLDGLEKAIYENFFERNSLADKVIQNTLKTHTKWGSYDRNFVSKSFYEIIRWKRHFEFFINENISPNNIKKIIAAYLIYKNHTFDYSIFQNIDYDIIKNRILLDFPDKSIKYSIPYWLEKIFENEVKDWENEIESMNKETFTVLRVSKKTNPIELKSLLEKENISTQTIENYPNALILKERKKITNLETFKNGFFEIQDANSQKVVSYLNIKKNQTIIDACAGSGGKTLQIAEVLENTGNILAFDISSKKLIELEKRAKRHSLNNIKTFLIDDYFNIEKFKNTADNVLIDSPCSGLGVLKRNPDAKWKLSENFIKEIKDIQKNLLQKYSQLVKVNGNILYCTCSVLSGENERQIEYFLEKNKNFTLILEEKNLTPAKTNFDGFYIALLKRIL